MKNTSAKNRPYLDNIGINNSSDINQKMNQPMIDFTKKRAEEIFNDEEDQENSQQFGQDDQENFENDNDDNNLYEFDREQQYLYEDNANYSSAQQKNEIKSRDAISQKQYEPNMSSPQKDSKYNTFNNSSNQQNSNSKPPIYNTKLQPQSNNSTINKQQDQNNLNLIFAQNYQQTASSKQSSNINSLQNTQKNNYFNMNNDSKKRNQIAGALTQDRYSPSVQQKVTVMQQQFRPYYLNSTYNRSVSKNRKKDNSAQGVPQIYENNNGQVLITNKVIRFTENGIKQTNELIQNYITSVPVQPHLYQPIVASDGNEPPAKSNQNSILKQPINMQPPDFKLQRDYSAPKGVSNNSIQPSGGGKRIRQYNKVIMEFQDKYYRKKTRPSHFTLTPEELYDENMQLKNKINQQDQFILLQKTQNKLLNNELEKQQELLKQMIQSSSQQRTVNNDNSSNNSSLYQAFNRNQYQEILLMNLKRELDIALKSLTIKEQEIKQLQKQARVTKFREVDEERKAYIQESFRLHKIIKDMITKGFKASGAGKSLNSHRGSLKNQEQVDSSSAYKDPQFDRSMQEEFMKRIHQYSNVIDQLQFQLSETNQSFAKLQEDNYELTNQRDSLQNQMQLLTQQIQLLQQQKHDAELLCINLQEEKNIIEKSHLASLNTTPKIHIKEVVKQEVVYRTSDEDQQKLNQVQEENIYLKLKVKDYEDKITQLNTSENNKDQQLKQEQKSSSIKINQQLQEIKELSEKNSKLLIQYKEIDNLQVKLQDQQNISQQIENDNVLLKTQIEELQRRIEELELEQDKEMNNYEEQKSLKQQHPPMPKTMSPRQIKQELKFSGALSPKEEEYTEILNETSNQENDDISGIQDNYGTLDITKKTKLSVQQQQQQLQEQQIQQEQLQKENSEKEALIEQLKTQAKEFENSAQAAVKKLEESENEIMNLKEQLIAQQQQLAQIVEKFNEQEQEMISEFQQREKELQEMIDSKDADINEQKQLIERDIKARLKRCLQILQIKEAADLQKFFLNNIPIQQDFSPLDLIVMRFNFTQYESLVIIEDLLKLNVKNCEISEVISSMINLFIPLEVASEDQILDNFKELQLKLSDQSLNVDSFLQHHGYENMHMIHYLLIAKTLQLYLSENQEIQQMVLHLLNQSKNFTQIDVNVLKRCLNLQVTARFTNTQRSIKKTNSARELQTSKRLRTNDGHRLSMDDRAAEKVARKQSNDQLELTQDQNDDTDQQLQLALDDIKGKLHLANGGDGLSGNGISNGDEEDNSTIMQLNMNANMAFSDRSGISQMTKNTQNNMAAQQKQIKFLKNVQLQLIAQALNSKFLNLRNLLRVYHTNQVEHILGVEVEVVRMTDFIALLRKLKVLQYQEGTEEDIQSLEMIEEMLIQADSIFTIEVLDQKVIIFSRLVQGLQAFGYQDQARPKSKKGMNFEDLDIKSIRLMNRLVQHVQKEVIEFLKKFNINVKALNKNQMHQIYNQILESIVFKGSLTKVLLKARNKEEKCYLITTEAFYNRLKELGIKRRPSEYENLTQFLWLDAQFPQYILYKKLVKAIELSQSNPFFHQIGPKKIALDDQTIVVKSSQINSKANIDSIDFNQTQKMSQFNNDNQNSDRYKQSQQKLDEESYYEEEEEQKLQEQDAIEEEQSYYEETENNQL